MKKQKQPRRLLSLDALRGFDMFFIMGGASLFVALGPGDCFRWMPSEGSICSLSWEAPPFSWH